MAASQINQLRAAVRKARTRLDTSVCVTVEIWSYEFDTEIEDRDEFYWKVWRSCGKRHNYFTTFEDTLAFVKGLEKVEHD